MRHAPAVVLLFALLTGARTAGASVVMCGSPTQGEAMAVVSGVIHVGVLSVPAIGLAASGGARAWRHASYALVGASYFQALLFVGMTAGADDSGCGDDGIEPVTLATEGAAIGLATALLVMTLVTAPGEEPPSSMAFVAPTRDGGLTLGWQHTF